MKENWTAYSLSYNKAKKNQMQVKAITDKFNIEVTTPPWLHFHRRNEYYHFLAK